LLDRLKNGVEMAEKNGPNLVEEQNEKTEEMQIEGQGKKAADNLVTKFG
jgi:hypothetical protein